MTVDALTLSKIDEAWNGFIPDILNKDSMVGTITVRNQFKNTERIIQLDNHFARSSRDGLHQFHGHEHKVQGRLPLL